MLEGEGDIVVTTPPVNTWANFETMLELGHAFLDPPEGLDLRHGRLAVRAANRMVGPSCSTRCATAAPTQMAATDHSVIPPGWLLLAAHVAARANSVEAPSGAGEP